MIAVFLILASIAIAIGIVRAKRRPHVGHNADALQHAASLAMQTGRPVLGHRDADGRVRFEVLDEDDRAKIHHIEWQDGLPVSVTSVPMGCPFDEPLPPIVGRVSGDVGRKYWRGTGTVDGFEVSDGPFQEPSYGVPDPTEALSDREERRRSFAYGNVAIDRPEVTRADIDRAAEAMASEVTR